MKIIEGKSYDVIVCGAGSAGFCAAVAAARNGASVAIVEKHTAPGGILTVLGNNSIDQFNNPFIPDNKMVITGIGWEFVMRLYKDGFARVPDMNAEYVEHSQYGVKVNPVAAAKVIDDMLTEAGVDIYYGQPVVSANTEENKIKSITVATKSGLKNLYSEIFIDCTGDGDLASFAGAECICGDGKGTFQPGTLRFYPPVEANDDIILNYGDNQNHVKINYTDSDNITRAEIESRKMIFEEMKAGKRVMATAPGVAPREGRRIKGLTEMKVEDYCSGKIFEDSVCYSYWFVDIHRDNEPAIIEYIKHKNTPTIRLTSMISKEFANLMMAGRCVSSDRETNSALRVKASCMAMGQAVGTAAAMSVKSKTKVADIPVTDIKNALSKDGAIVPGVNKTLEFEEVFPEYNK